VANVMSICLICQIDTLKHEYTALKIWRHSVLEMRLQVQVILFSGDDVDPL